MNECDALFIAGGAGRAARAARRVLAKAAGRVAPKIPFIKAIGEGAQILAAANLTLQNRSLDFAEEPAHRALSPALSNSLFIAEQTLTLDDPKGPDRGGAVDHQARSRRGDRA